MRKSFAFACLFVLLIGALAGCKATDKTPEAASSAPPNAANAAMQEGKTQYMAVCTTKEEHEGNEYVLTKWLDTKYKAEVYGKEHARKRKGHEVIYKERIKP